MLQLDEFECRTGIAKLKNLLEPHNEGFEFRTGASKGGKTHTSVPANLLVLAANYL